MKKVLFAGGIIFLAALLLLGACASPAPAPAPTPAPAPVTTSPAAPKPTPAPTQAATPTPAPTATSVPKYPTLQLKASSPFPQASVTLGQAVEMFLSRIEERTGRAVTFTRFYGGTLAKGEETLDAVQMGLADFGQVVPSYIPGKLPASTSPLAFPFRPASAVDFTKAWSQAEKDFGIQQKELAKFGAKLLYFGPFSDYGILSRQPIRNLDDLKGKKVIQVGGYFAEYTKVVGITPIVGLTAADRYEQLRNGVADASLMPPNMSADFKDYEVTKYQIMSRLGAGVGQVYVINMNTWNKLPPELQKLFLEVAQQVQEDFSKQIDKSLSESVELMKSKGINHSGSLSDEDLAKWASLMPDTVAMMAKGLEKDYPQIWDFSKRVIEAAETYGHKWPRKFGVRQ